MPAGFIGSNKDPRRLTPGRASTKRRAASGGDPETGRPGKPHGTSDVNAAKNAGLASSRRSDVCRIGQTPMMIQNVENQGL